MSNAKKPSEPQLGASNGAQGGDALDDETQASAAVLGDLESLRGLVSSLEQERDQFRGLLQRTQADFENYQKRVQREVKQEVRYASSPLMRDLLPALDNLDRATAAAKKAGETGPLVQGVAMVQSQFFEALKRHGITRIEAQGQPFDPNLHQAVMQQASKEHPPNTVVQVLEQGFMIHDRVLRPASVVVSKAE
jgi:molecular chaperone GrpE